MKTVLGLWCVTPFSPMLQL